MKFLFDENTSRTFTRHLQEAGFDVVHVVDVGLAGKSDNDVMKLAQKERRVIITHDKDFGNLIRFPLQQHFGVIMIRLRNQSPLNATRHVLELLEKIRGQNLKSCLVILAEQGFRLIRYEKPRK